MSILTDMSRVARRHEKDRHWGIGIVPFALLGLVGLSVSGKGGPRPINLHRKRGPFHVSQREKTRISKRGPFRKGKCMGVEFTEMIG